MYKLLCDNLPQSIGCLIIALENQIANSSLMNLFNSLRSVLLYLKTKTNLLELLIKKRILSDYISFSLLLHT